MKANETGVPSGCKCGSLISTKVGAFQQKSFKKAMWPRMALFWSLKEGAEHVVGQWYNEESDEELGPLHGIYGSMEAELKSSAPSRGRS